jgi:hypothetical protein
MGNHSEVDLPVLNLGCHGESLGGGPPCPESRASWGITRRWTDDHGIVERYTQDCRHFPSLSVSPVEIVIALPRIL